MKRLLWILLMFFSTSAVAQDVKTYIHPRAIGLIPLVYKESIRIMPDFQFHYYFPSLIEHESCIHLKHKKCWSSESELNTSRELGVGLGQLTKTYKADGSIRFDKLDELRRAYRTELKELSWSTIKSRPDLQIRAIVIMTNENYKALFAVKDPFQRLKMADYAYNGGLGAAKKDRQICGLRAGCDPQYWEGHVELHSAKSRKAIYGNRSAYDISRHHVHDTTVVRLPKFKNYYETFQPGGSL